MLAKLGSLKEVDPHISHTHFRPTTKMIYCPEITYNPEEYFPSSNGNIISRCALICKPQAVEIPSGRCVIGNDVVIRGDFAAVILNKYCYIGNRSVIRPAYTELKGFKFIPVTIGSHTYISEDCVIEAAIIGSGCFIGKNAVLSKRCVLKDFVHVMDNAVVPPGVNCQIIHFQFLYSPNH